MHLIGIDRRQFSCTHPGDRKDLLDGRVLPAAVLVDVRGGGTHLPLDVGVPLAQFRVASEDVSRCQVVAQCQRPVNDDIGVRVSQSVRFLEGPSQRDAAFAEGPEPDLDQCPRSAGYVAASDHDVAVDDGLGGEAWHGSAPDMLDAHDGHTGGGHRLGILPPQEFELLWPCRVVLDYQNHVDQSWHSAPHRRPPGRGLTRNR